MANSTFHASRFTNPLVIAGLDGATWGVLDPLLAAGRLPTLGRLIERGSKTTLRSTWPPISAAAWITVITGLNPGRHGVFDFRNLDLGSYTSHNEELATVGSYSVPTLFDYLGWAGRAAIAYQVPLTYPPRPISGYLVAGYPTPDPRRAYTYPSDLAGRLVPPAGYTPDQISAATPPAQANYYHDSMRAMTENLLRLSREQWDLLMFVNGATDGAQHRFFKFVVPDYPGVRTADRARYGSLLAELMIAADAELGRLLEHLPPNVNILVISDHGAIVRPRLAFNLNAWLAQEGFLTTRKAQAGSRRFGQTMVEWARQRLPINEWVKRHLPRPLKQQVTAVRSGLSHIEWAQTQAYRVKLSHPIEGIHLNLAGRQAQGVVNPPDYTKIRDAIIERLNQRPEVVAVHPREAIHHGPYLDNVPDILVQLRPEYDGGADFHQLVTTIPASWLKSISGYHALPGILVAAGPDVRPGRPAPVDLVDITPTALHLLNVPVPADLDGRVLQELLATERPVEYADGKMPGVSGLATALSAAETAGILATLRDLGYVE